MEQQQPQTAPETDRSPTVITSPASLHQRHHRPFTKGIVAVVGGGAVAAVLLAACSWTNGRDRGLSTPESEAPTASPPSVAAEFRLPGDSAAPVFTAGAAWIATQGGQLTRVDPETNKSEVVRKRNGMGGASATSAFGSIWLVHEARGLFRLDTEGGALIARIPKEVDPESVGFGSLWGTSFGHEVVRVDPDTNTVVARLHVSHEEAETHPRGCEEPFRATCPDYLTVHQDRVVMFIDGEDAAVHIDPATNQVIKRVEMPAHPSGFFRLYGEDPWVMTESGLVQVDLDSGEELARIPLRDDQRILTYPAVYHAIAVNGDTAWLVTDYTTTVIDLKRAEVVNTFDTPGASESPDFGAVIGASFGHGDLWVTYAGGKVLRLDPSGS